MKRVGGRYPARSRKRGGALDPTVMKSLYDQPLYGTSDAKSMKDYASLNVTMAEEVYSALLHKAADLSGIGSDLFNREDLPENPTPEQKQWHDATNQQRWDSRAGDRAKLLNIGDSAPLEFYRYVPWFLAYDVLQIKATNPALNEREKIALIKIAELMRTLPPKQDPQRFSRWEEFYRDFKDGVYGGGKETWLYNQRISTPYDPTNPLFHFTPQRSRIEVKGASPSLYGDYDVLRILDVKRQGTVSEKFLQGPFVGTGWGGRSRRTVYPSRRRA